MASRAAGCPDHLDGERAEVCRPPFTAPGGHQGPSAEAKVDVTQNQPPDINSLLSVLL